MNQTPGRQSDALWSCRESRPAPMIRQIIPGTLAVAFMLLAILGCNKETEPAAIIQPEAAPTIMPAFLRGTIRYEADLLGYGPTFVQGYGLVVGLSGTGSDDTPIPVRGIIEREAGRMNRDRRIVDSSELDVQAPLDSRDTAVVLVEAMIPPGAPADSPFDIHVAALPTTSTTSLEGGRLWTTFLYRGLVGPDNPSTMPVATAKGDVFINPFADTTRVNPNRELGGEEEEEGADQPTPPRIRVETRMGRVMSGGRTLEAMPLVLQLRTPSYSRSRALVDAINSRFHMEPGQWSPTARPISEQSDERIEITVPPSWAIRMDDFIETLMHTTIFRGGTEQRANSLVSWIKRNPIDAPAVGWCWVALGETALPVIQELYDYPEILPRLAALKSGAKLDDPLVVPYLAEIARDPENDVRINAVQLLGEMEGQPRVGMVLRELLNDDQAGIRVASYEGLRQQNDVFVEHVPLGPEAPFELFSVPSDHPMVYVTLQGQPRITVFGRGMEVQRPVLLSLWGDRFILASDTPDDPLRLQLRDARTGEPARYAPDSYLIEFIRFLGHKPGRWSTQTGLALDYSQTIAVLHRLSQGGSLEGPLRPESDYLMRNVVTGERALEPESRPETSLNRPGTIAPPTDPDQGEEQQADPDQQAPAERPITSRR